MAYENQNIVTVLYRNLIAGEWIEDGGFRFIWQWLWLCFACGILNEGLRLVGLGLW